jgi:hypothetical protein
VTEAERDSLYRVAYDEAVRALASQQVLIDSLRSRAGLLLSAAAVTTSFLGSQALDDGGVGAAAWAALVVFAATSASCLAVLWPRRWERTIGPQEVIRTYIESPQPASPGELLGDLAIHNGASFVRNRSGLQRLADLLQLASTLLVLDVVIWTAALAIGR